MKLEYSTLFFGTFNAEAYLDDDTLVQLPSLPDVNSNETIHAMDELLFPLCKPNDFLLTMYPIQPIQKEYLNSIKIQFSSNDMAVNSSGSSNASIFSQLCTNEFIDQYKRLFENCNYISPYAYIPDFYKLDTNFTIRSKSPKIHTVRHVNSKIYSHTLHKQIGIDCSSMHVTSIPALEDAGKKLFGSDFIIKYPFGVAGKGTLHIHSAAVFNRIVRYCTSQVNNGKRLSLIIEPFLDKKIDFSCQLKIDPDGTISLESIQQMENNQFGYSGSTAIAHTFFIMLHKKGYFSTMHAIAEQLYRDGYFGNVCIDSMLLKNDSLVPLVEINARKSMGLINHYIDMYFQQYSLKSYLRLLSVGLQPSFSYERLLHEMKRQNILYQNKGMPGIIPLSANTLTGYQYNGHSTHATPGIKKGRLYFAIGADNTYTMNTYFHKFKSLLASLHIILYN